MPLFAINTSAALSSKRRQIQRLSGSSVSGIQFASSHATIQLSSARNYTGFQLEAGVALQSLTTGLVADANRFSKSTFLTIPNWKGYFQAMHNNRLSARNLSIVPVASRCDSLGVPRASNTHQCFGRPASLKHFGFNVSPPPGSKSQLQFGV